MTRPSMPVSVHCALCGTFTVPGSSLVVDPTGVAMSARITATCPRCRTSLNLGVHEGPDLARFIFRGARVRPIERITPLDMARITAGDWDRGAVEELMM